MQDTYDDIVVGAGAAGCVLAERLSSDPQRRVLVLEAGGSDKGLDVSIPAAFAKLFRGERDWAFDTAPQRSLKGRRLFWPRGKMLGGSASMNAQMYVRGSPADYDGWAEAGCSGWSWSEVRAAFTRLEGRDRDVQGLYGREGPQRITDLRDPNVTTFAFVEACAALGFERLEDINQSENEGVAHAPVIQHRGRRFSAADAWLRPALQRPNLEVRTGVLVERLLFDGRRAIGVSWRDDRGARHQAFAQREVVLAAGAVGSPHLLLRSGVGPADALAALDIPVVAHAPGVGENLQDHLLVGVVRACPEPVTLVSAESPRSLLRYFLKRRGMLSSNVAEALAMVRTAGDLPAPDLELLFAPVPYIDHGSVKPSAHGTTIGVVLLQPESRGRITLASADPRQAPRIDPGYLTDAAGADLSRMVAGVRLAQRLYRSPALARYAGEPLEPEAELRNDRAIEEFIRAQAETLYHPVGTCRMGADAASVVDPTLRVRGVEGLRVADASIMPRINRGHTYAPTVMIAEQAAAMMLAGTAAPDTAPPLVRRAG